MADVAGRSRLLALARQLLDAAARPEIIEASEYLLEPGAAIAVEFARWELPDVEIDIGISRPEFRPPFEWLVEITMRWREPYVLEHYLITDTDVVSAKRRDLTPLNSKQKANLLKQLERLPQGA